MNEEKQEEVRIEAKKILDNFGKTIEGVKLNGGKFKKDIDGFREEATTFEKGSRSPKYGKDFRDRMFANAKNQDGEHIIAEKKEWQ